MKAGSASNADFPDAIKKKFEIERKLSIGYFGATYKARDKQTKELLTLKSISDHECIDLGLPIPAIREIAVLGGLVHPNIVRLNDFLIVNDEVWLMLEFFEMNLSYYLAKTTRNNTLPLMQVKFLWYQILQAVCYCHQRGIVHRDLKPRNILINKKGEIKLTDFSCAIEARKAQLTSSVVTLWYRAPELLLGSQEYTLGIDMWAVGCTFAEIASSVPLFPGDSEIDQIFKIFETLGTPTEKTMKGVTSLSRWSTKFPVWTSKKLRRKLINLGRLNVAGIQIIENLLMYEPRERTSAKCLLKDLFFNDLDKKLLPAGDWNGGL